MRPEPFPTSSRPRHRGLAAIGGGAAGAAVVGVLALGAAGSPQVERRAPATDLNRPSTTSSVDAKTRPVRRTRTPTPSPSTVSGSILDPAGQGSHQSSGRSQSVRHLLGDIAARGTMAP
jgi:hypothetical protein